VASGGALTVRPIEGDDVERVAAFLAATMRSGPTAGQWARSMRTPWAVQQPNHGFMLESGEDLVGANLAFYSERKLSTGTHRFCNVAALSVVAAHRAQAVRLVRGLLRQPGHVFTDLSPSGQVVGIDRRLGFRPVDTTTAVRTTLGPTSGGFTVLTEPDELGTAIEHPGSRRVFEDHRHAPAARHALLLGRGGQCYVLYRRDRRKRLPVFASLLHVSDPDLYLAGRGAVDRALLREGALATLVELRVLGGLVPAGARLYDGRPKMVRGDVPLGEVDDLYSELTCVPW